MMPQPGKVPMDTASYARRARESRTQGRCFLCEIASGTHSYPHQVIYEDDNAIAFLNRYPTLVGYCLVAPKEHVESWVHDLTEAQFLAFQGVTHRVARAIEATVPTERMYSLSLGSQQANAHLHWHIAPLPPGVPYDQQEFHALRKENGVLDASETAQAGLARAIRSQLQGL
jgi:diadenosine tetraphosphate (Ap4A) HIT family hydrolase